MAKMKRVLAMMSVRHQDGDQKRNGKDARIGSYAVPGTNSAIFYVTESRLKVLQHQRAVRLLEDAEPVSDHEAAADDAPGDALPLDFPHRDLLIAAGLKTRTLVREFPDLTEIDNIGSAKAKNIRKALDGE